VWRGLDGLRRILHLILLLLIFGVLIGALRGSVPSLPQTAALFLQPQGEIVEQLASDPIRRAFDEASGQGVTQTLLWDLTEAIESAATDDRIKVLVLQLDYFEGAGQPTLTEIAAKLKQFRATGKKVVAYAGSYSQASFFLAAFADEIYLDPMGEVLLEGYQRYRMYYKGLIDKLSVDVHLFRVGAWKSAAEDLIRKDMSPEDRSESEVYLNALWKGYTRTVAEARGIDAASIDDYANGYIEALRRNAGDTAAVALEAGLVTGLATEGEFTERIAALLDEELVDAQYPSVTLGDYLMVARAENKLRRHPGPHVGVVVASGEIADGEQPPGTIGGVTTSALLRGARDDDEVAAVVLRIDSPGGSVFASEQIYREVLALKAAGKPVVVSMGDMAASGGYYIAAPADRIFASPMTLTGSIGIFAVIPTVDRTLGKLGITVDGVGTTALSGKLRVDRPLDPALRDYITLTIERGYELFLTHVAAGRNTTRDAVHEVAQGRVWVGEDALRLKLVDELGTYQDAVAAAARLADLPEGYGVERIEPELTWAEQLASQFRMTGARLSGHLLGPSLGSLRTQLAPLSAAQTEIDRLRKLAESRAPLAYCFCSVE
jgi:protease-4